MRTIRNKYKLCYKTRCNIWGNVVKFRLRFKNKKWNFLKFKYSPKQVNNYGSTLKYFSQIKRLYRVNLIEKQKMKLFYGNLLHKKLLNYFLKIRHKKNNYSNFIQMIESRLDIVIYRAQFSISIFSAQEFIRHGFILVNHNIVTYCDFLLKPGDLITLKKHKNYETQDYNLKKRLRLELTVRKIFKMAFLNKFFNINHLEINYRTFSIIFLNKPELTKIYYPFSLYLQNSINFLYK